MNNPQYIEYLNTFGAEINISSQLGIETDALLKEHTTKDKKFKTFQQLFRKIIYLIGCSKKQIYKMVKYLLLDKDEQERQRLIDSIEKMKVNGKL